MRSIFALITVFVSWSAYADENLDYGIHQDYIAVRAMGAGNTFTVIDDYNLLFYNPAGLGRAKDSEINLGFGAAVTTSALAFSEDIKSASKVPEAEKIAKMQEILDKNYGKNFATRLPAVNAIWTRPKWGVGLIIADSTINLAVHQLGSPQIAVSAYVDNTLAVGFARGYLEEDALTLGFTLKGVYRGYVGKSFNAFDLATNPDFFKPADANEGLTGDVDIGSQYVMPIPESGFFSFLKYAQPTFALVVRNLADYGFKQNMHLIDKNSGTNAPKLGRRVDVGSKWELPHFSVFSPRFMLDMRDLGHRHSTFLKSFHTGVELGWKAFSWLEGYYSAGMGQGYLSAGVGAQLAWFRLDAATYGEEIGTSNAKKENRFYIAKMSLDF